MKPSERFKWSISVALLFGVAACAPQDLASQGQSTHPIRLAPPLSQTQLTDPGVVAEYLTEYALIPPVAERVRQFRHSGDEARRQQRWGTAAKEYGEAALLWPDAAVLNDYAEAYFREMSAARQRQVVMNSDWDIGVLSFVGALYRSAIAADVVMPRLSEERRTWIEVSEGCIRTFLETSDYAIDCEPVNAFLSAADAS